MTDYYGRTLDEAIHNAVNRFHTTDETKWRLNRHHYISAPAKKWSRWTQIWAVIGHDDIIRLDITFEGISAAPSTFDIEIKGGMERVRTIGPGAAVVYVGSNIATGIYIRARSHSISSQKIQVYVG